MHLVLDPSVVIKWYVPEVLTVEADRLKERIRKESRLVAVPQLFLVESANVLWKKSRLRKELSRRDAETIYSRIVELPFHRMEDQELLPEALDLAFQYSISVYDAIYLACALHYKAVLITADISFVRRFENSSMRQCVTSLADLTSVKL